MAFHDIGAAEAGSKGVMYSALLPLLGAICGYCILVAGTREVAVGDLKPRHIKTVRVMFLACVVCGLVGAFVIHIHLVSIPGFVPGYAGMAAGLVNGVTSCIVALCMGWFGKAFTVRGCRQPKLFVGGVLVIVFIMFVAMYGLIVSLIIVSKAANFQVDMAPGAVYPFVSIDILANLGAAAGSVASGIAILQVGEERPDCFMRMFVSVNYIGVTGIFGLASSVVDIAAWPPTGNDSRIGIFYLLSSMGLAYVGHYGVKQAAPDNRAAHRQMILGLVVCQSIGFAGFMYGLVMHWEEGHIVAAFIGLALTLVMPGFAIRGTRQGRELDAPLLES